MLGRKTEGTSGEKSRKTFIWIRRGVILLVIATLIAGGPYAYGKLNRIRIRLVGDYKAKQIVAAATEMPRPDPTSETGSLSPILGTVNRLLQDAPFTDVQGKAGTLREYRGQIVVISMTSIGCPVSKKAMPALARMGTEKKNDRVQLLIVNPDPGVKAEELQQHAAQFPGWRYVSDPEGKLTSALSARTTTETFVIDESQTLRYRGALDDRFDVGSVKQSAEFHDFLGEAITAVVEQRKHFPQVTPAPGCTLTSDAPAQPASDVTWHNQIARFIQVNCLECHRPGEAAPFALETYEQVFARKAMIETVLEDKTMPPWFADAAYGHWRNARLVSEPDRLMFTAWIKAGCPKGDPIDEPTPLRWPTGWTISAPDVELTMTPQQIPAEGFIPWRIVPVDYEIKEDLWVSEAEIKPSSPEVVHHAMLFVEYAKDDPRGANQTHGEKGQGGGSEGYWLSYFPGRKCMILPEGRGKLLPKGGKISIQMHYNPNGTAVEDRTVVGLKFLPGPPKQAVISGGVVKGDFVIPPNSKSEFIYSKRFAEDVRLIGIMPHMHSRGAAAAAYLQHADGRIETLVDVPKYDFDWQISYEFDEPMLVAKGSRIVIKHAYDNTPENPDNPDPTQEVRHGNATSDEMMINFFEWEPAGPEPEKVNRNRPFE